MTCSESTPELGFTEPDQRKRPGGSRTFCAFCHQRRACRDLSLKFLQPNGLGWRLYVQIRTTFLGEPKQVPSRSLWRLLDDGLRSLRYLRHQLGRGFSGVDSVAQSRGSSQSRRSRAVIPPDALTFVFEFAQRTLRSLRLRSRFISCRSFLASCFKLGFICQATIP